MKNVQKATEIGLQKKRNVSLRCVEKVQKWLLTIGVAVISMISTVVPVSAAPVTINDKLSTEEMIGGIIEFICQVARYMGFVVIAAGIFMFVFAYKDDNAEAQSRAARFAVIGAILLSLKTILTWTGLIN